MPYVDSRSGKRIVKRKMIVIPCINNIIEVQSNQSLLCRNSTIEGRLCQSLLCGTINLRLENINH